jgi:hypothetical protein
VGGLVFSVEIGRRAPVRFGPENLQVKLTQSRSLWCKTPNTLTCYFQNSQLPLSPPGHPHFFKLRYKSLWRWYISINIMFPDIPIVLSLYKTSSSLYFKTQRFGDCILSPSSGKTYSVGPDRKS